MHLRARAIIILSLLATGCAGMVDRKAQYRLDTPLQSRQFNSFASQHLDRPTHVSVSRIVGGPEALVVLMDPYGHEGYTHEKVFLATEAQVYLDYIAIFKRWAAEAVTHGDILEKPIGKAKSLGGQPLQFGIYSGNAKTPYLTIETCTLGMCGEDEFVHFYDLHNAQVLTELLTKLHTGELKSGSTGTYK